MPDSPRRPQSLDEAFEAVIHSMRVTELSARTGFGEKDLYRWATPEANPSEEHRHPPAKVIEPLSRVTGRLDVVAFLADRLGYTLVAVPGPAPLSCGSLLGRIAALTREFGDIQLAVAASLVDGRITADEVARIDEGLLDLIQEAASLRHALSAQRKVAR